MEKADLLICNGRIYAGKDLPEDNYFVAVKDGRIIKTGTKNEMDNMVGEDTTIVDLEGEKMLMPGFHDSHTHLIMAGMYQECINLDTYKSEEETARAVAEYAKTIPEGEWIIGFKWYHLYWGNKTLPTTKYLDKYIPDRPVFLLNAEAHGAWVNSEALKRAGIDKNTPEVPFGEIMRDEEGNPSGFLYEAAQGLVAKYAFDMSEKREKDYIRTYLEKAKSYGITGANDMLPFFGVNLGSYETFYSMAENGELTTRIYAAADLCGDLNSIEKAMKEYSSDKYGIYLLKQFVDGVATTYTALLVSPYSDNKSTCGSTLMELEDLRKCILNAHKRGLSVRLHACGDGAVRAALDGFEEAIEKYGDTGARHAIEHNEVVHPNDLDRYKKLGVIASYQPEHLAITDDFESNSYPLRLGEERCKFAWPIKTILDTGANVSFGSDCPVVDNSPFLEIYRAITRLHNDGLPKGGWNPKEKISIAEALHAYTYVPVYGVKRENDLGTLEEGKIADMIVIDRDLFRASPQDIRDAKVLMTFLDGELVYEA